MNTNETLNADTGFIEGLFFNQINNLTKTTLSSLDLQCSDSVVRNLLY